MFDIKSPFKETGDQPQAIKKLIDGLNKNIKNQCLLGVKILKQHLVKLK